jgi:hypothetical protein
LKLSSRREGEMKEKPESRQPRSSPDRISIPTRGDIRDGVKRTSFPGRRGLLLVLLALSLDVSNHCVSPPL